MTRRRSWRRALGSRVAGGVGEVVDVAVAVQCVAVQCGLRYGVAALEDVPRSAHEAAGSTGRAQPHRQVGGAADEAVLRTAFAVCPTGLAAFENVILGG